VTIKLCANCRHLKVLDQGREFEFIIDTEYTLFECDLVKKKVKEFYLMAPVNEQLNVEDPENACPGWELWKDKG
jgi:hypothetical protein